MGNCCASEARADPNLNMGKTPKDASDFPAENVAIKVAKMNAVAPNAEALYRALGEWKQRSTPSTLGYQHDGPYQYKDNNSTYQGQYLRGLRSGLGTAISSSGEVYTGNFHEDKAQGQGRSIDKEGVYYEGDWKNGKKSGFGKEVSK